MFFLIKKTKQNQPSKDDTKTIRTILYTSICRISFYLWIRFIPAHPIRSTANGSIMFHWTSINVENPETKGSSNSPSINTQGLGRFLKNPWGICGKRQLTTKPFLEYFLLSGSGGFLVVTWPWRKCMAAFPCSGATSHGAGHRPQPSRWPLGMVTQTSWLLS